jgi:hypothetical protein
MDVRNLVLEIAESESAADVQARLDMAAEDGYFLVNVVGRLAFLRTTVTPRKPEPVSDMANPKHGLLKRRGPWVAKTEEVEEEDACAVEFLKANLGKPNRIISDAFKKETGIVRSYMWFQRRRKDKGLVWPVKSV